VASKAKTTPGDTRTSESPIDWQRNNFAAALAVFLLCITFAFTNPFLPLYIQKIDGISLPDAAMWAGIAAALQGIGAFCSGPLWGMAGDRWGRKPMLVRACLGGATGLLLLGFVTTAWQVLAIRLFIGIMAGAPAAAMALVAAGTPSEVLPKALGRIQASILGGSAMGPLISIGLVAIWGYRTTFITAGFLMFSGAAVVMIMIREPREALAPAHSAEKQKMSSLLRAPVVWAALGLVMCLSFAGPLIQPILSPYVVTLLPEGTNPTVAVGLMFFGVSAASAMAAIYAGRLIARIGIHVVLPLSIVGVSLFLFPMGFVKGVGMLAILVVIMSLFQGLLQTSSVSLLPTLVSATALSSMFGLYQSVSSLSSSLGPAIGGIAAAHIGFSAVFPIAAIASVSLALPMFYLFKQVAKKAAAKEAAAGFMAV
jgi:DHA1 family multidrug resistance protein-like MFS transporter